MLLSIRVSLWHQLHKNKRRLIIANQVKTPISETVLTFDYNRKVFMVEEIQLRKLDANNTLY